MQSVARRKHRPAGQGPQRVNRRRRMGDQGGRQTGHHPRQSQGIETNEADQAKPQKAKPRLQPGAIGVRDHKA